MDEGHEAAIGTPSPGGRPKSGGFENASSVSGSASLGRPTRGAGW